MFGLFYALVLLLAFIISGTRNLIEDSYQVRKAKEEKRKGRNKYNLYTDRLGATRDLDTGQLRTIDYIGCESQGKDQYLRDIYGNPIRNLSMERREARVMEAKKDPRRSVSYWKEGPSKHKIGCDGQPFCTGRQYRDLKSGDIYVCRLLSFPRKLFPEGGYGMYYMDIKSGLLVRETDCQKLDRNNGVYDYNEEDNLAFIDYFNEKQKKGGYYKQAHQIKLSGWEQKESEFNRNIRMGYFYCNNEETFDEPSRRLI